jgi:hypothetical protein
MEPSKFSRNTSPNLFNTSAMGSEYNSARDVLFQPIKDTYPIKDTRYPAYANTMQDGRLVTDYRPQCSKNVRPGKQFYTKLWMINHATNVIEESRRRQVEWSGASLPMANTVPPPSHVVKSTPFYSEVQPTGLKDGIGVQRAHIGDVPLFGIASDGIGQRSKWDVPLFGTFVYEPTMSEIRANRKNIGLNQHQEGGRNSRRGGSGV